MQASPPETTENSMLVAVATAPDSMSPSRGPPWTTAIWMEDIRLRKRSGMVVCRMVLRSTAETTSAQPAMASRTRAIHRVSTRPKAAMAAPQTMTATMTARPGAAGGRPIRWRRRRSSAPTPGAA